MFVQIFFLRILLGLSQDSSVDITDSLRAGRFGDRILVGAIYSAPVQTAPGFHPAFYSIGTGSFPGVKEPGRGIDHPPPSSAEDKESPELYL